jgi:hypothetical protein
VHYSRYFNGTDNMVTVSSVSDKPYNTYPFTSWLVYFRTLTKAVCTVSRHVWKNYGLRFFTSYSAWKETGDTSHKRLGRSSMGCERNDAKMGRFILSCTPRCVCGGKYFGSRLYASVNAYILLKMWQGMKIDKHFRKHMFGVEKCLDPVYSN